jgi:hypothetical protein
MVVCNDDTLCTSAPSLESWMMQSCAYRIAWQDAKRGVITSVVRHTSYWV